MREELGKIKKVTFGHGGYQDTMIGVRFDLGGESWGVSDFWGYWGAMIERSDSTQWTELERNILLGETTMKIYKLLVDAKVDSIEDLEGIPVRVKFEGMSLKSWEVLKEVL